MPPSPQEATWTQTHPQPGAGGSGFWNSAPWIPLLAPSPNTPTCEDTHEGAETPAKEEEEGGCSAASVKISAGGRVQAACDGAVGPSLQGGGGLSWDQGVHTPSAAPWDTVPKTWTALDDDSAPVPREDPAGPGLEVPLAPNLQRLPAAHGYSPLGNKTLGLLPGDQRSLSANSP